MAYLRGGIAKHQVFCLSEFPKWLFCLLQRWKNWWMSLTMIQTISPGIVKSITWGMTMRLARWVSRSVLVVLFACWWRALAIRRKSQSSIPALHFFLWGICCRTVLTHCLVPFFWSVEWMVIFQTFFLLHLAVVAFIFVLVSLYLY